MAKKYLAEFQIPSEPGNERLAAKQVLSAVEPLNLPQIILDRLGTAVAEAAMNAMEHGNNYRPNIPVDIQVYSTKRKLVIRISDHGGGKLIFDYVSPDLYAKLEGAQSPRGWGLFLIQNMVDDLRISSDDKHRTMELILYIKPIEDQPIA